MKFISKNQKRVKVAVKSVPEVKEGIFSGTTRGFGFVQIEGEDDIFVPEKDTKGALHGDTVLVQIASNIEKGKKREGKIVKIVKRDAIFVVGTFEKSKNYGFVVPDNLKLGSDIYIAKEHTKGAVNGHKVYVKITDYGNEKRSPEGRVVEILGHINDPAADVKTVLKSFNLETEFPKEVMEEAQSMPESVSENELKGRFDIRGQLTVTIDGEDAKDLDDAITIKKENGIYELGVHIADVTHYVKEGSPLDKCALGRGTSVYLVDRVIPMLPHRLSNGICSLNAGVDRLALSCFMEFDETGTILGHRIAETVIRVTRRMSYNEVYQILETMKEENNVLVQSNQIEEKTVEFSNEELKKENDIQLELNQIEGSVKLSKEELEQEYGELIPKFLLMKELSDILRNKRHQRGAVDFDFPESKITIAENGRPIEIKPYERNDATKIIEDFMLAANETIAEDFFWQEAPFVYRTHENPDPEKIQKLGVFIKNFGLNIKEGKDGIHPKEIQKLLDSLEGKEEGPLISRLTLRSLKQAKYSTDCEGHFGLAAKYYCHFTSPIRRYPDLQIHRIIKDNLNGRLTEERKEHYIEILDEVALNSSKTERLAEEAEREVEKMKKVEYMERRIGEVYDGVISGVTNWGIYVELPNTVEGIIRLENIQDDFYRLDEQRYQLVGERFHKVYRLGQHITIMVLSVDKLLKTIDFLPFTR